MKLIRKKSEKKQTICKKDTVYEEAMEGLQSLLNTSDVRKLIKKMDDHQLDLFESWVLASLKRAPTILKFIREEKKERV